MRAMAQRLPHFKFILPHAPQRPVTLNMGMRMPAWYDIFTLDHRDHREDDAGILESVQMVHQLVKNEREAGVERVFIGGFSQGGVVALSALLTATEPIDGAVVLSAYLPHRKTIEQKITAQAKQIPLVMAHGQDDQVVQYRWGEQSFKHLRELGISGKWLSYPGLAHSCTAQEIDDLVDWLTDRIGASKEEL